MAAAVLALAGCGGTAAHRSAAVVPHGGTQTPSATASPTWIPWTVPPGASLVAQAVSAKVPVYRTPGGPVHWVLPQRNTLGAPLIFLVRSQQPFWYSVYVPVRPNGSTGWVRATDVSISADSYSIVVSESAHKLWLYRFGRLMHEYPVAVGAPAAPTPTGHFYLTELLRLSSRTAYSPVAYGLSAFSAVFSEFEGGPGQIGLHGTTEPWTIGYSASHGCVRMYDADVEKLATFVPPGTPITITD